MPRRKVGTMSDDDASFSSSSDSSFSDDQSEAIVSGRRRRKSGFASMMHDWMGDERSVVSGGASVISAEEEPPRPRPPQSQTTTEAKTKKKRLVPVPSSLSSSFGSSGSKTNNNQRSRQREEEEESEAEGRAMRCYLIFSEDDGSLSERYSITPPDSYLARWTPPDDNGEFPTDEGAETDLIDRDGHPDPLSKAAYFEGMCEWINRASAKSRSDGGGSGAVVASFERHAPGRECDVYLYRLGAGEEEPQTTRAELGEEFTPSDFDAVAISSRGLDFLHSDPRLSFRCGIDRWVAEGGKLGFATKLDTVSATSSEGKKAQEEEKKERGAWRPAKRRSTLFGSAKGGTPQSIAEAPEDGSTDGDTDTDGPPKTRMVEGAPVYVRDPHYSWLPATVASEEDDKRRIKVAVNLPPDWEDRTVKASGRFSKTMASERLVKLSDYGNDELPLQNVEKSSGGQHASSFTGKNDMADLTHLHEAAILYNLKARHARSLPYTRVGDILVAVNPFRWIDGLYAEEKRAFYAENIVWANSDGSGVGGATPKKSNSNTGAPDTPGKPLATAAREKRAVGYDFEKLGISPHVYETSSLAYLGLAAERADQTILVTGESGAGKTETIKIVMNHLATVEKSRPNWPESDGGAGGGGGDDDDDDAGEEADHVSRILQANPLFEAFGNAKTSRNDNSSRFGKFTQLLFDVESAESAREGGRADVPSCRLAGSKCVTYLLEKTRVVGHGEGERSFHVFYQMLGAPEEVRRDIWEEGLVSKEEGGTGNAGVVSAADFAYLGGDDDVDGLAGGENWPDTVAALAAFGISGPKFRHVARALCAILQLGNIAFEDQEADGGSEEGQRAVSFASREELGKLSGLMGVPAGDIEDALTKRVVRAGAEEFTVFLKGVEARDGRDALAKEIYASIFDLLVTACNESTEPTGSPTNEYGTISLLDIFGFESFKVNKFEQLCINYCNERLQQKYVQDNFEAIKSEYEEEGVNVFDFSLVDNSEVMTLLEGKLGLITQLNEECIRKNGSDESFVYKFKVVNSNSDRIIQDHLHRPYEFGIRHYAAPIKYDARMFIERNLDKIPPDLLKCAVASTNPLISEEFQRLAKKMEEPKTGGFKKRSEATKHLVVTKFKRQLASLMSLIENSRTRYIRCIKPNKMMAPTMMDHAHTVSQLESAGLVTAIVISRESFPNRLSYELIMERFRFLAYKFSGCNLNSGDIKADAADLIGYLLAGVMHDSHAGRVQAFSCGKTSVYFRTGALEKIETIRQEYYAERAVQLQAWYRSLVARRRFMTLKRGVILLQSEVRSRQARVAFRRKVQGAVIVQCFVRKCLAAKELLRRRRNHASTVIQTAWRRKKPREMFKAARNAAIRMQCFNRMVIGKKEAAVKKKERDEQTAINSRMTVIQQTFDDATTIQGSVFSVDEGLLDEVETMFEFLRKEIVVLRKKNSKLKKDLAEAEADKREIFNQASGVDHAFSLAKIRNEQMAKTNMALLDDNNRRRKEINSLKNELKTQQQAHEAQLQEMRAEFELSMRTREMELSAVQHTVQTSASLHRREVQAVRDESEKKQEEQHSQIVRLREEIKNTQDSHQDYLSKLMGVLETTQQSRRNLMAPPSGGLILRQKEEEISKLRDEVARLGGQAEGNGGKEEDAANKKEAIKSMKYIVKKNREHRKSQVQHLVALAKQLDKNIMSGDSTNSQQLLKLMNEAILTGEKSNSKMDRETVNMIENTALYSQGGVANANAALVADNQKLRRKLEKKNTCEKCGYKRDRKNDGESVQSSTSRRRPGFTKKSLVESGQVVTSGVRTGAISLTKQHGSWSLGNEVGTRKYKGRSIEIAYYLTGTQGACFKCEECIVNLNKQT